MNSPSVGQRQNSVDVTNPTHTVSSRPNGADQSQQSSIHGPDQARSPIPHYDNNNLNRDSVSNLDDVFSHGDG